MSRRNIKEAEWLPWEEKLSDEEHLPWLSYQLIDLLRRVLTKEMDVFEWGCGSSTFFFAKHARSVTSIEHNPTWFKSSEWPSNANVRLVRDWRHYETALPRSFDLIVVDGRHRVRCLKHAIGKVPIGGRLLLDNSNRHWYRCGIDAIPSAWGKKEIKGATRSDPKKPPSDGKGVAYTEATLWMRHG